jgi:hypothetical protein
MNKRIVSDLTREDILAVLEYATYLSTEKAFALE